MVSAVAGTGAAGQAQLERLQHQLSDNVNCASAKTPAGKATISAIEDKISALKQTQQKEAEAAPAPSSASVTRIGDTSGGIIDVYA